VSKSSPIDSFPRRHAATRRFTLGSPRSFQVSEDGERIVFLRSAGPTDSANSLWVLDRGTDPRRVFDAAGSDDVELTEAEKARRERRREQAGGVVSYVSRGDGGEAVFVLGGDLHRVDLDAGAVTQMASNGAAFDPTFEPGGLRVCYVGGTTLRITDGVDDRVIPGTDEDAPNVSWGSAEFVAAEEMGRGRGYWWSQDGQRLAACRVDTSAVDQWWVSAPARPESAPQAIRYPGAGTTNAEVQLWIVDVDDGPTIEVPWNSLSGDAWEYLVSVSWGPRLLVTVQTRDQRTLAVAEADPNTGQLTEVLRVTDDVWVEIQPRTPLDGPDGLVMIVDEGNRRLSVDGEPMTHTMEGVGDDALQIRSLIGMHPDGYLVTCTTDATDAVLAVCDGDGNLTALTDAGAIATAVATGSTRVVSVARPGAAPSIEVVWNDGSTTALKSLADAPGFNCTPSFHVVGERSLNTALCLPSGHDGSPLPVLLDPYGGPHAQRVLRSRNAFATSQWFAEQGFAVVVTDGRGTPSRGPAFEREIYGDFATKVLDDQIDALHALANTNSVLDLSRVGIRGWSFGGYLAALAVMRRPDAVHAAVAGAPVTEWRLYDTHYTERYLGHPDDVPEHYDQSGLLGDAGSLGRPLMLIHGLADDNVVAAHTLQLSQALLEAGKPHEVLPLSGVTHMTPQETVAENLLHLQRDFLLNHLTAADD